MECPTCRGPAKEFGKGFGLCPKHGGFDLVPTVDPSAEAYRDFQASGKANSDEQSILEVFETCDRLAGFQIHDTLYGNTPQSESKLTLSRLTDMCRKRLLVKTRERIVNPKTGKKAYVYTLPERCRPDEKAIINQRKQVKRLTEDKLGYEAWLEICEYNRDNGLALPLRGVTHSAVVKMIEAYYDKHGATTAEEVHLKLSKNQEYKVGHKRITRSYVSNLFTAGILTKVDNATAPSGKLAARYDLAIRYDKAHVDGKLITFIRHRVGQIGRKIERLESDINYWETKRK